MTDRPIIFSAPMVRAMIDGRKTMTRRLAWRDVPTRDGVYAGEIKTRRPSPWQKVKPGDRLWVKETFSVAPSEAYGEIAHYRASIRDGFGVIWTSSRFMPRRHSRLTLLVTATKIERLQAISEEDCLSEGVRRDGPEYGAWLASYTVSDIESRAARGAFKGLWIKLHGSDAWDANPEVVAVTFDVRKANIDTVKG